MLFFGLNYYYKFINKNVFEIKKITGAYAVAISKNIIDDYEKSIINYDTYIDTLPYEYLKNKNYKLYGIYPNLIIPKIKDSDINIRPNDKKLKKLNNWNLDNYTK